MSDYPGATLPFPSLRELRDEFADQIESEKFREVTVAFCQEENINLHELVGFVLGCLQKCTPRGVEDLAQLMLTLIEGYHLKSKYSPDSSEIYEAVKGIPAHSNNRIGYTFQRRKSGEDRGVFVFLR